MTTDQKRKILIKIQTVERDIETVQNVIKDLATQEFVSATISTAGGSKSYTRRDIGGLTSLLNIYRKELSQLRCLIFGKEPFAIGKVINVYDT